MYTEKIKAHAIILRHNVTYASFGMLEQFAGVRKQFVQSLLTSITKFSTINFDQNAFNMTNAIVSGFDKKLFDKA